MLNELPGERDSMMVHIGGKIAKIPRWRSTICFAVCVILPVCRSVLANPSSASLVVALPMNHLDDLIAAVTAAAPTTNEGDAIQ